LGLHLHAFMPACFIPAILGALGVTDSAVRNGGRHATPRSLLSCVLLLEERQVAHWQLPLVCDIRKGRHTGDAEGFHSRHACRLKGLCVGLWEVIALSLMAPFSVAAAAAILCRDARRRGHCSRCLLAAFDCAGLRA
jgi:hypothetical protein